MNDYNMLILWINLDNNLRWMYKMASLVGQWQSKNIVHEWLFVKLILVANFVAIPYRKTIDIHDTSIVSPDRFHSIEDDGERDGYLTQDNVILSISRI